MLLCVLCKLCCQARTVFANTDMPWETQEEECECPCHLSYYHIQPHKQSSWIREAMDTWHKYGLRGKKAWDSNKSCIVFVRAMDSSTEDLTLFPFIVLNKNCYASVFISVSQFNAYDRNMSVWKNKPAVAWLCQVQTSLCVLNKEWSISRKSTEELYGGAISHNGAWEAATYTPSSWIVLALFSPTSLMFSSIPQLLKHTFQSY